MSHAPRIELQRIRVTHARRVTRVLDGRGTAVRAAFLARGGKGVGGKTSGS